MSYEMNEEQKLFQSTLEKLFERHLPFEERFKRVENKQSFDSELWAYLAQSGMLSLHLDEKYGGIKASIRDIQCLMEVMGKYLLLEPYASFLIGSHFINKYGSDEQKENHLPGVMTGETKITCAIHPDQKITTRTQKHGDHWHIDGDIDHVIGAEHASHVIFQSTDTASDEPLTIIINKNQISNIQTFRNIDDSTSSNISLKNIKVAEKQIIDWHENLFTTLMPMIYALQSAEMLGVCKTINEKTRDYLKQRIQFNQPLSGFQALQHRMVETFLLEEQINSISTTLGLAIDHTREQTENNDPELIKLALQTNILSCQYGKKIGEECVQMHGGMGVSHELDISHYFRKITLLRVQYGDQTKTLAKLTDTEKTLF